MTKRRPEWWVGAGVFALLACTLWLVAARIRTPANERRSNVLLITVDTLRRDHVSLYGYERNTTPYIDAFFKDGTTFERATSPSPCTNPAVKQVLSGVRDFDDGRPRLAEMLRLHRYATAAVVSQQHFRTRTGPRLAYRRGFDHFDIQDAAQQDHHHATTRGAGEVSDRAIAWLDSESRTEPFFLWLHYFDPHDPYEAPARYRVFDAPDPSIGGDRRTYMEQARSEANGPLRRAMASKTTPYEDFRLVFSPQQAATLRSYYDAEILYVDAQVDRVLRKLEDKGMLRRTLVIFTADHGERLGEDGRWDHCQSVHGYEIDVPLMLSRRGPDGRARVGRAVSTLDIVPTVLSAAGVAFQASDFDGRHLFEASTDRLVYAAWNKERAIQNADWKLTVPISGGRPSLHDIGRDSAERQDLARQLPQRVKAMSQALVEAMGQEGEMPDRIAEVLEELRAVGYVQ